MRDKQPHDAGPDPPNKTRELGAACGGRSLRRSQGRSYDWVGGSHLLIIDFIASNANLE